MKLKKPLPEELRKFFAATGAEGGKSRSEAKRLSSAANGRAAAEKRRLLRAEKEKRSKPVLPAKT
jgi:hypothetical protein